MEFIISLYSYKIVIYVIGTINAKNMFCFFWFVFFQEEIGEELACTYLE